MAGRPKKENTETVQEIRFTKEQFLLMKQYKNRVDLLGALLEDGKEYSVSEADALMIKFLNSRGDK